MPRLGIFVVLVVAGTIYTLAIALAGFVRQSLVPAPVVSYLSVPNADQMGNVALSDDVLAYAGSPLSKSRFARAYIGDISRWRPRPISRRSSGVELGTLSNGWNVWSGSPCGAVRRGKWEVCASRVGTNSVFLIDSSAWHGQYGGGGLPQVGIAGSTVVWSYPDCLATCLGHSARNVWRVAVARIPNLARTVVAGGRNCVEPESPVAVAGARVIWLGLRGHCPAVPSRWDLLETNIRTKATKVLVYGYPGYAFAARGRFVAWVVPPDARGNGLYLLNLRTGHVSQIGVTCVNQAGPLCTPGLRELWPDPSFLVLTTRILAWHDNGTNAIMAYDLRTHKQYVLARGSDTKAVYGPGFGWNNLVGWRESDLDSSRDFRLGIARVP